MIYHMILTGDFGW